MLEVMLHAFLTHLSHEGRYFISSSSCLYTKGKRS